MKILFDPIYSTYPSQCGSTIKFYKLALRLLADHPDTYIRWLVPDYLWDMNDPRNKIERDWLLADPRIEYIPVPYHKDRLYGYRLFDKWYEDLISFKGKYWDTDAIVTMRTQQVPNMKIAMTSPRSAKNSYLRRVFVMEDMPVMSFKGSVPTSDDYVQDLATTVGYLCSDRTFVTVDYEKKGILNGAQEYLSPSKQIELRDKIQVVNPAVVPEFRLKDPKFRFDGKRQFLMSWVGRIQNTNTGIDMAYDVMEKQWILNGDEAFKAMAATVTKSVKVKPPKCVDLNSYSRDEYITMMDEQVDLTINLFKGGGFSLSVVEPLMLGVPGIIGWDECARSLIGDEYPFFVKTEAEAFGIVKAFMEDYETMYAIFAKWHQEHFVPRFQKGGIYEFTYYDKMSNEINAFRTQQLVWFKEQYPKFELNDLYKELKFEVRHSDEFLVESALNALYERGVLSTMGVKLTKEFRDKAGLVWLPSLNEYRIGLKAFVGLKDLSTRTGHMGVMA